jgi:outer membrane receptor protein involved in Fe transport
MGIAGLLLLGMPAAADEGRPTFEKMTLEELLATQIEVGSLHTETIFNTPSTVSVIDREMIERYGFLTLAEALRVLAGFDVTRTHFKRDVAMSRGILQEHYANKVLVMINGVAAWNAVTGEASLERIDIRDVERVEVLKGPASVLYGTNAYAGAVNVILRIPDSDADLAAHVGAGDRNAFQGGGRYAYSDTHTRVFVAAGSSDEAGEPELFTDEHGESGWLHEYLAGSQFTAFVEHGSHSLLLNGFVSHESFLGTTPEFDTGIGNDHVARGYLASYTFSRSLGSRIGFRAGASFDRQSRDFSRSRDDLVRGDVEGYRASAFTTARIEATSALSFELGADYDYRRTLEYSNYRKRPMLILADNNMDGRRLSEYSGFGQMRLSVGRLKLLGGMRLTHNELFGSNLSGRGTLVYSLNDTNSVKVIVGQSYRAPSLFELYFQPPTNTVFGNLNLKPETSDSFELAYVTSFKKVFAQALLYHARYDGKIFRVRRATADPLDRSLIYVNGAPFSANGAEIELRYKAPSTTDLFVNYNYVHGDRGDEIMGNDHYNFKYVPRHSVSGGAARGFGRLGLSVVLNLQSGVQGPLRPIDGWASWDVNASYHHELGGLSLRHMISAKNAADADEPIPEFVRRNINDIPSGNGRRFIYTLTIRPGGQD